jgi:hypothetical protein
MQVIERAMQAAEAECLRFGEVTKHAKVGREEFFFLVFSLRGGDV